jgi:hypothetical protein
MDRDRSLGRSIMKLEETELLMGSQDGLYCVVAQSCTLLWSLDIFGAEIGLKSRRDIRQEPNVSTLGVLE